MPAQITVGMPATARTLIQILATMGTQSLAVLAAQCPLWKFEDNIFAHIGRQVHEILALQFLMKHKLVDFHRQIENAQAPTATQGRRRGKFTGYKYRCTL